MIASSESDLPRSVSAREALPARIDGVSERRRSTSYDESFGHYLACVQEGTEPDPLRPPAYKLPSSSSSWWRSRLWRLARGRRASSLSSFPDKSLADAEERGKLRQPHAVAEDKEKSGRRHHHADAQDRSKKSGDQGKLEPHAEVDARGCHGSSFRGLTSVQEALPKWKKVLQKLRSRTRRSAAAETAAANRRDADAVYSRREVNILPRPRVLGLQAEKQRPYVHPEPAPGSAGRASIRPPIWERRSAAQPCALDLSRLRVTGMRHLPRAVAQNR